MSIADKLKDKSEKPEDSGNALDTIMKAAQQNAAAQGGVATGMQGSTSVPEAIAEGSQARNTAVQDFGPGYYTVHLGCVRVGPKKPPVRGVPTSRGFFYPLDSQAAKILDQQVARGLVTKVEKE